MVVSIHVWASLGQTAMVSSKMLGVCVFFASTVFFQGKLAETQVILLYQQQYKEPISAPCHCGIWQATEHMLHMHAPFIILYKSLRQRYHNVTGSLMEW